MCAYAWLLLKLDYGLSQLRNQLPSVYKCNQLHLLRNRQLSFQRFERALQQLSLDLSDLHISQAVPELHYGLHLECQLLLPYLY